MGLVANIKGDCFLCDFCDLSVYAANCDHFISFFQGLPELPLIFAFLHLWPDEEQVKYKYDQDQWQEIHQLIAFAFLAPRVVLAVQATHRAAAEKHRARTACARNGGLFTRVGAVPENHGGRSRPTETVLAARAVDAALAGTEPA